MSMLNAAQIVEGRFHGEDTMFHSVSIDSRQIGPGGLFVAITGEHADGHSYLSQSSEAGAVGTMVSSLQETDLPQIVVADPTRALGMLGSSWRDNFAIPVTAVTGSNGKTTVTRLISSILNKMGKCLSPEKSYNNQWGVPLTLLRLNSSHQFAVVEMGTSHNGEIQYLSSLAKPVIALINNVSAAHVEGLGNVQQISLAKSEIFSGMADGGTAVLNADDEFFEQWRRSFLQINKNGHVLTFGTSHSADIRCENATVNWSCSEFYLNLCGQRQHIALPLAGMHNIMNATAAAAAAYAAGADSSSICTGLESAAGAPGRLNYQDGINHATVIDDSYNANPRSVMAAIDVLAGFHGKKILVMGEMAELGTAGPEFHHNVGCYARMSGIDKLYCLGQKEGILVQQYLAGFGRGACLMHSAAQLTAELRTQMDDNTAVLVKGSRSSAMERVVGGISSTKFSSNCLEES